MHKYDPKDLQDAFSEAQVAKQKYGEIDVDGSNFDFGNEAVDRVDDGDRSNSNRNSNIIRAIRDKELAEAQERGLLDLVVVDRNAISGSQSTHRKTAEADKSFGVTPGSSSNWSSPSRSVFAGVKVTPSSLIPSPFKTETQNTTNTSMFVATTGSSSLPLDERRFGGVLQPSNGGSKSNNGGLDEDGNSFMSEGDMSDDDLL